MDILTLSEVFSGPNWSSVGSAQQNHDSVNRGGRFRFGSIKPISPPARRCLCTPNAKLLMRPKVTAASSSTQLARSTSDATAIGNPEDQANILLQPGDSLHVPEYSPTVEVTGAVNSPVTVLFREGANYDYYLESAGGYRFDADKGKASVQFANGLAQTRSKFLFWSSYPTPGPGSLITVPAKDPADRIDTRGLITDIVSILTSVTTLIVVIVSLN